MIDLNYLPQIPRRMQYGVSKILSNTDVERGIYPSMPQGNNDSVSNGDKYQYSVFAYGDETTLVLNTRKNTNCGIFDVYIDGSLITSGNDDYASSSTLFIRTISVSNLSTGNHTIELRINGKNAASSGYSFGSYWVMLK